jgi:iron complex outermembrane receptor protein
MNTRLARGAHYALIACISGAAHVGATGETAKRATVSLRIAAQPLDEALQEFSRQSSVQIVFFSHIAEGVRSPGVNGDFTLDEAMKALLTGSGLTFRIINSRTIQVFRHE